MSSDSSSRDLLGIAPYGEALKEATSRTLDGAAAFLSRICLPAAEEFGLALRDKVHQWRTRNLGERVVCAAELVAATGVEPREVPMRTLTPLLEGASREDDPELAALWTALLANAAHPSSAHVPPIYPVLLGQLSPLDARVLICTRDLAMRGLTSTQGEPGPPRWGPRRDELLAEMAHLQPDDLEVSLTTLSALGLMSYEPTVRLVAENAFLSDQQEVRLSPLGERFLAACEPPAGRE